jgi:hypothetical protein
MWGRMEVDRGGMAGMMLRYGYGFDELMLGLWYGVLLGWIWMRYFLGQLALAWVSGLGSCEIGYMHAILFLDRWRR